MFICEGGLLFKEVDLVNEISFSAVRGKRKEYSGE